MIMIIIYHDQVPDRPEQGVGGVHQQRGVRLLPRWLRSRRGDDDADDDDDDDDVDNDGDDDDDHVDSSSLTTISTRSRNDLFP